MASSLEENRSTSEAIAIRCPNTGFPVFTGISATPESFQTSMFKDNSFGCSVCRKSHTWNKRDAFLVPIGKHRDEHFKNRIIVLDGGDFNRCKFEKCEVFLSRGNFSLTNSEFDGCKFRYFGEADVVRNLTLSISRSIRDPSKP